MAPKANLTKAIEQARTALAETDQKLAERGAKRSAALLTSDDDNAILVLDKEIDELARLGRVHRARIEALESEVKKEAAAQIVKRKAALIDRIEAKIDKRDEICAKLQAALGEAVKLYNELIQAGAEIAVAVPWNNSDLNAAVFISDEIKRLTMHELCRVGSGQLLHGGAFHRPSFPGGLNPKLDWLHCPERIPPLVDAIAAASALAKRALRSGQAMIVLAPETAPAA
jgi:hypothetical protein